MKSGILGRNNPKKSPQNPGGTDSHSHTHTCTHTAHFFFFSCMCVFLDWLNLGWIWTLRFRSKACTTLPLALTKMHKQYLYPHTHSHTHTPTHIRVKTPTNKPHKSPCIISILSWQIYTSCQSMALCEYCILLPVIGVCVQRGYEKSALAPPRCWFEMGRGDSEGALSILIGALLGRWQSQ